MKEVFLRVVGGAIVGVVTLFFVYCQNLLLGFSFIFVLAIAMAMEWNTITATAKNGRKWSMLGVIYIACSLLPITRLKFGGLYGNRLLMWLLILVWSMDTFAYVVGQLLAMGAHKINSISPGKSYEGLLGGTFFSLIFCFAFSHTYLPQQEFMLLCLTPIFCCLEQVGDFTESYVKRTFGFKNSGNAIPGHGGFLDRFDGFLYTGLLLLCLL
ncbi:MAG: phosphatidate cytidylyltransferase [Rickettsiales bacterium]|nr:phosphatidate cytidylyltransferase [Rickettsiales bacterium]